MKQNSGWLVALVLFIALLSFRMFDTDHDALIEAAGLRADSAQAEVLVQTARADSLEGLALRSDTVLVRVVDSVRVVVTREREISAELVERIEEQADSVVQVLVDSLVVSHAAEVAAIETRLSAAEQSAELWRATSFAKDSVIATQATEIMALRDGRDALASALRSKNRQSWFERAGVVVVVATLVLR